MFKGAIEGIYYTILISFILFSMIIVPAYIFGPELETKYFPVVEVVRVVELPETKTHNRYVITFNKLRQCIPRVKTFAWYTVHEDGTQERVPMKIPNILPGSRPRGFNISSIWHVDNINKRGSDTHDRIVLRHDCFPFWPTQTVIDLANDQFIN